MAFSQFEKYNKNASLDDINLLYLFAKKSVTINFNKAFFSYFKLFFFYFKINESSGDNSRNILKELQTTNTASVKRHFCHL